MTGQVLVRQWPAEGDQEQPGGVAQHRYRNGQRLEAVTGDAEASLFAAVSRNAAYGADFVVAVDGARRDVAASRSAISSAGGSEHAAAAAASCYCPVLRRLAPFYLSSGQDLLVLGS